MRKKIIPLLPVVGLYCLVVALVFGRALLPGATEMIWGDDIHRVYYFFRQFFISFLREGIWPWWNPYIFSGAPFIADPVVNIWYPPTWLFVFLPLNIAYSWHIALHIFWAMVGMYTLIRTINNSPQPTLNPSSPPLNVRGGRVGLFSWEGELRVVSMLPAWTAGLVFGLSGFFSARIWAGHVDVIAAASWMPWVVWAFTRRGIVLAAGIFALQILAGYQTMAFFTMEAVGMMTLFFCLKQRSAAPAIRAILAVLLGLGLAAIQIIPTQEFFRASIRTFSLPYSWNSYGSLTIASLKQFFNPFIFGDHLTYSGPPPNYPEHAFFVGRVGIVFVIVFLLSRLPRLLRSPRLLMFCLIAFFGLWVSLGPNAPIDLQYILWKFVPMYKYLRVPPRHLILVVFGLSGLIGIAMQRVKKPFSFLIMLVISAEMILYARHFIVLKPIPEARHDGELIKILKQDNEPFRVLQNFGVWVPPRDSLDFDAAMSYRIFSATGYDPSILRFYYEYIDLANGNTPGSSILTHDVQVPYLNVFSQATDFLNIKYILVPREYDPLYGVKTDRFVLLREDVKRDYRLYENKSVKPRFFFEKGTVVVKKYTPNEIVLSTDDKTGETLFSSEVFYPGWEGFIDGKKVNAIKANHAFRALFVPAGKHTVTYRYSPRIFLIGGLVSLITAGLCLIVQANPPGRWPTRRRNKAIACIPKTAMMMIRG